MTGRISSIQSNPIAAALPYLFEAIGIEKRFDDGQVQALRGVDFRVAQGEFVAVTGPSGCGKTTLLQMLGALDRPTQGTLLYRGNSIPDLHDPSSYRAHEIGFIFQAFHLLPTFTALENVQIPMFETDLPVSERRDRAVSIAQVGRVGAAPATIFPPNCPAEKGSASPLPAAWPMVRPSCSRTNRPATSTAKTRARSSN